MQKKIAVETPKFGSSDIYMLMAVVFWAVNFSLVKIALREFSPLGFNGIRMVLASAVLVFVLRLNGESFSLQKSQVGKLIILGIAGNTVFQLFFIHGINLTTASNTSLIMAMAPGIIALLSSLMKHERLSRTAWTGILVSFLGFSLVITSQNGAFHWSWQTVRGDVLIFAANFLWAFYTVFSKPVLENMSPLKLTSMTMVVGAAFFLPFSVKDLIHLPYSALSWKAWASLLYSGVFALAICYVIWYVSVKRVGNSRTAIYNNFVPVITVLFAYFSLGERITLLQAAGALVIFAGVYLTRSGKWAFYPRE